MSARALVLTYHSANVSGTDHASNDHVALAEDLWVIAASGWRFATLDEVLTRVVLAETGGDDDLRLVALTCDDGLTLDARDFDHPAHGLQRSFLGILQDAFADPRWPAAAGTPTLASFVIASPEARAQFDHKDFLSLGLWDDAWWAPAHLSGWLSIESHSWDHNHPSIDPTAHKHNQRGSFLTIDTEAECDAEIRQASAYIATRTGRAPRHLAYPWGQTSDYLRRGYLPQHGAALGLQAAWSCEPAPVVAGLDRWYLPRYVCGQDWHSARELGAMLHDGGPSAR